MNTREKIIELADTLIRTKGYNSFSYKEISTELNIKNAAIHYYFPKKEDLGKTVVLETKIRFLSSVKQWQSLSPDVQLNNFLAVYRSMFAKNEICIVGSMVPHFDILPEVVQVEIRDFISTVTLWLKKLLQRGREEGVFDFAETLDDKINMIMSQLISSLIMGQILGEKYFESALNTVLNSL